MHTTARIDTLKQALDDLRPVPPEVAAGLKKLFDVDFTYNSTAIEGNTFSFRETKILLQEGLTIGGKTMREHLEIINHKEAIDYIEALSRKKPSDLHKTDLCNLHAIILKSIDAKHAGTYRAVPVYVQLSDGTNHRFCDPLKILDEMEAYFDWLIAENTAHPLIVAAEAHTRFVSIHPFIDGNGRMTRLIMNLMLLQRGFIPVIIKHKDRTLYLDAIEEWQQHNNKDPFYNLIITYEEERLEQYLHTIKNNILWK
ncbi:MAG: Fic family protein [Treponema sp.]|jgi:Fic family protein|nr:Fic family protein [Treponema sp.]